MAQCEHCGAGLEPTNSRCPKCGSALERSVSPMPQPAQSPQYAQPPQPHALAQESSRNKVVAGILALLLGTLGAHKFYLGKIGWGIVYLLFCWTYIPTIVGIVEGISYLTMSDDAFERKYGGR